MTVIHAHGGLANRLRAVISWRHVCGPITVAWLPDEQVFDQRFSDAFKPLSGVEFIDRVPGGAISTFEPHPFARPEWMFGYRDLEPIEEPPPFVGPYAAVHMRRTDAITYQNQCNAHEPDSVFIDWCKSVDLPIFLATDNYETQRVMVREVHARVHHIIENSDRLRKTPLLHAVWDIWTCARATKFRGSGASSFTNLIHILRALHAG